MNTTFLFYDTETSGTNHCFDQIFQFAAIRTDKNLLPVENGEIEFRIKLRPDIIPAPGALLTTKIGIDQLQSGLSEYEAIQKIHQAVNQPGTISTGYNLFKFDDLMLRFAFYRNLLSPYDHQYKNECWRWDMLPLMTLCYLYEPNLLNWPQVDGQTKLKLDLLNQENNLATGDAHDALVDVRITVTLAQKIKRHAPKLWASCFNFFNYKWVKHKINNTPTAISDAKNRHYAEVLLIHSRFGAKNNYQKHALHLGYKVDNDKRGCWLLLDQAPFSEATSVEAFPRHESKLGESTIVVPYTAKRDKRPAENKALSRQNLTWIEQNCDELHQIRQFAINRAFPPLLHPVDSDAKLYEAGFAAEEDCRLFERFHHTSNLRAKQEFVSQFRCPIRKELGNRLLFRNYPVAKLDQYLQEMAQQFLHQVSPKEDTMPLFDYKDGQRMTPYMALAELEQQRQRQDLSPKDRDILEGLEDYILTTFIDKGNEQ